MSVNPGDASEHTSGGSGEQILPADEAALSTSVEGAGAGSETATPAPTPVADDPGRNISAQGVESIQTDDVATGARPGRPTLDDTSAGDPASDLGDHAGALQHLASRASLRAEADELVVELRARLDDAAERFDEGAVRLGDEEWRSQLRATQGKLVNLFRRWDWDQSLLSDDEASSILRTCTLPDADLSDGDQLSVADAHLLWVIPEKPESAGLLRALRELETQLCDRPSAMLQPLHDAALARYLDARYGQRDFIGRLEHTLAVGRRLLNMVPALMAAATIGTATTQLGEAGGLGDFAALALARLQVAVEHYEELHSRCAAAESELCDERDRLQETGAALFTKSTELAATVSQAEKLVEERDRAQAQVDQLRSKIESLVLELDEARREATELRQRISRLEDPGKTPTRTPAWSDAALEQLYRFTWKHERVNGNAGTWYSLLRAAVADDASEAPAGLTTMIMNNNNIVEWPPAPGMSGLTEYRSVAGMPMPGDTGSSAPASSFRTPVKTLELGSAARANRGSHFDLTRSDDEEASDDSHKHTPRRGAKRRSRGLVKAQLRQSADTSSDDDDSGSSSDDDEDDDDVEVLDSDADLAKVDKKKKSSDPIVQVRSGLIQVWLRRSVYDGCIKVPSRPAGEPAPDIQFPRVGHPFQLGTIRGRSSTVPYVDMLDRQREVVNGISTQAIAGTPTSFYPNYRPSQGDMREVMTRLDQVGIQKYQDFLDTRPWDAMWAGRVKHFFLFDPNECSAKQIAWLKKVFVFMYEYREAYWTLGHWLIVSRTDDANTYPEWYEFYRARTSYIGQFKVKAQALSDKRPPGMTDMVWSEPAVWMVSSSCSWIPSEPESKKSLAEEVASLDKLEPIRARWSSAPGRFVEALLGEQLDILDQHVDELGQPYCWAIPAPYDSSDPEVFEAMAPTASFSDFARRERGRRKAKSAAKRSKGQSGKTSRRKTQASAKSKAKKIKRRRLDDDA